MTNEDSKFIRVSLDDSIIKAQNESGEEKLRFAMTVAGHEVLIRFPTWADWDFYVNDLAKLFLLLSRTSGDIELNSTSLNDKDFQKWAYLMSQVLRYKECRVLVDKIFFDYLRPIAIGVDGDQKEFLRRNLDISHLFYMFTSILNVEDWIKKKSMEIITKNFPTLTQPSSRVTSAKSSTCPPPNLEPGQPYAFD